MRCLRDLIQLEIVGMHSDRYNNSFAIVCDFSDYFHIELVNQGEHLIPLINQTESQQKWTEPHNHFIMPIISTSLMKSVDGRREWTDSNHFVCFFITEF